MNASRRRLLASVGAVGATALAGCSALDSWTRYEPGTNEQTDWPMARYDTGNTGYVANGVAPRDDVTERWRSDASSVHPPAIADGTAYLSTFEGVTALDTTDGSEQWRVDLGSEQQTGQPVVHNARVFVTAPDRRALVALDATNGETLWQHTAPRPYTTLTLSDGEHIDTPLLILGGEDGLVQAVHPIDGREAWRLDVFGRVSDLCVTPYGGGPTLYVGTTGGEVYAYWLQPAETPSERWRRKLPGRIDGLTSNGNGAVAKIWGRGVVKLQNAFHAGSTARKADQTDVAALPVYARSRFVGVGSEHVGLLWRADGELSHSVSFGIGVPAPVAAGDTLYTATESDIRAFDMNGSGPLSDPKLWTHSLSNVDNFAVADGALFAVRNPVVDAPGIVCLE